MFRVLHRLLRQLPSLCWIACWLGLIGEAVAQAPQSPAHIAFVAGIDRYSNLEPDKQLLKAVGDARAVREAFARLGYRVFFSENATRIDFLRQWQEFLNGVRPGDETAVYFAGHGVEIAGANFLIPGDVPRVGAGQEELLKGAAIPLDFLLQAQRDRAPRVSLVILDACRNNPFATARGRTLGRSRGLTDSRPPSGTFIMYSAGVGQQALDVFGDGDQHPNSIYTRTLIPLLTTPGVDINDLARRVRHEVHERTNSIGHLQTPAYYDELIGQFCPAGCVATAATPSVSQAAVAMGSQTAAADASALPRTLEGPVVDDAREGPWLVKGKSRSCPLKEWTAAWRIAGETVFNGRDEEIGKIDRSGKIAVRLAGRVKKHLTGIFSGRLQGDQGSGSFAYPGCDGTFTMNRP